MKKRVVVTGIGLVTPLGIGIMKNWENICGGKSGIGAITRFDSTVYRTRIAGEVKEFHPEQFMSKKIARRTGRFIQLAIAASRMAVEDSGLNNNSVNSEKIGVSIATALGGADRLEESHGLVIRGEHDRVSPFFLTGMFANMASGEVAIEFGAKGPNLCSATACAAGTNAIGSALGAIRGGEADVMIAGGADAPVTPTMYAGLDAMRAMSTRNDEPERASRPFDKERDGFVTGEGSGVLILEEKEHALRRGAAVYAEVLGYGRSCDAYHITAPDPEGEGAIRCMRNALNDAETLPDGIDCINAHGTSTKLNDIIETKAIEGVFGKRSASIPISANKSMTGHLWGASGAVEAIFSILTIKYNTIPPTINYENRDTDYDLDYVPNTSREVPVNKILSNSFGFGGTNASLIIGRFVK